MNDTVNRQILLVEKPTGKLGPEHFKMVKGTVPEPKDGEVLVRTRYISLDAANRAWMHGATYRAAVEANTVMAGGGIAEVVSSKAPGFSPGDIVFGDTGWQDYAAVPAKHLTKMPKMEPMTHLLSVYGIAGLTAYFGLLHVGKPKEGETALFPSARLASAFSSLARSRIAARSSAVNPWDFVVAFFAGVMAQAYAGPEPGRSSWRSLDAGTMRVYGGEDAYLPFPARHVGL